MPRTVRNQERLLSHDVLVLLVVLATLVAVGRKTKDLSNGKRVAKQNHRAQRTQMHGENVAELVVTALPEANGILDPGLCL